ncbi:MAG: DUF3536 domain-containing protein [Synergistaceae bacterium]|nr:DUF3536 domain-containing protein [Synergistaceae bacterium]
MPRYICIHGHFYQPPRENPWLETVELQESAAPWHDWNARISDECYSRNAASRILNEQGEIARICNNYSRMSFNFGPTLLSWLEEHDPLCYRAIIEADAVGRKRFSGHGPAMAQVYNHIILPLANRRDKETQVRWGIADFKRRFGRMPEGMWLAETAADTETLEVLAENGILFTVLSPYQADSVRSIGWGDWQDARDGHVDTRCAYRCNLPSGRSIALFFYDGMLSQKIAFEGLLNDGGSFARQLINAYPDHGQPVLSHVATDGESYGHHHKNGDMALAYCLDTIDHSSEAQLTVYGEYLSFYPPESEVRIIENSSWSCAHGVERWRSDCGCSTGTAGFHQKWRAPLRKAMNDLRDELGGLFEEGSRGLFLDPWNARNRYIEVILDRSEDNVNRWLEEAIGHAVSPHERVRALSLMEMERNSLLMFTSCGWFFDEISRIEPLQILRYAARAMELAKTLFDVDLEPAFLRTLAEAPSNIPELRNGAKVYELLAKQGNANMAQMAAYYGITSLLRDFTPVFSEGCWDMSGSAVRCEGAGVKPSLFPAVGQNSAFSAGTVRVRSRVTGEEGVYLFAANHRGGTSILCGVCEQEKERQLSMDEVKKLRSLFDSGATETDEDWKALVAQFGYRLYSLRHIPADAQHQLLNELLQQDVQRIEGSVRDIVSNYDQLLEYLTTLGIRPPAILTVAAEFTLTSSIIHKLQEPQPNAASIRRDFELASFWQVRPNEDRIRFAFADGLKPLMERLREEPEDVARIESVLGLIELFSEEFRWDLGLHEAQNQYYELLKRYRRGLRDTPEAIREPLFRLGRALRFSEGMLKR